MPQRESVGPGLQASEAREALDEARADLDKEKERADEMVRELLLHGMLRHARREHFAVGLNCCAS